MRTITKTHTGKIISDTDLTLEYLYVGDYGKENNIKASFLGYDKRIDKVEHKDVVLEDKLVVTVSSQKGCPMKCNFCDCPKLGFNGNVSKEELISQQALHYQVLSMGSDSMFTLQEWVNQVSTNRLLEQLVILQSCFKIRIQMFISTNITLLFQL